MGGGPGEGGRGRLPSILAEDMVQVTCDDGDRMAVM